MDGIRRRLSIFVPIYGVIWYFFMQYKDQLLVHLNKIHLRRARQVEMRLESLQLVLNAGYMLKSLGFFSVVYFLHSWKMQTRKKMSASFVKILFFRLLLFVLKTITLTNNSCSISVSHWEDEQYRQSGQIIKAFMVQVSYQFLIS